MSMLRSVGRKPWAALARTASIACTMVVGAAAAAAPAADEKPAAAKAAEGDHRPAPITPQRHESTGSVRVGGQRIDYQAVAGTLVVDDEHDNPAATMSYVAYLKTGANAVDRPITFLWNGGPGSSTIWLHLGAFGPRRVVVGDAMRAPAAPYPLVENEFSLIDVTDLVFIDAPGTGFGRIGSESHGEDAQKEASRQKELDREFLGVDQDLRAFEQFIVRFLGQFGRWNSPKYLFGESYGTTRAAALAYRLQGHALIDVNGVILLSQILDFSLANDLAEADPGVDLPYALALPTYSATAWYHKRLPDAPDLDTLIAQSKSFALGEYASALAAGDRLDPARQHAAAVRLHELTGLPVEYLEKSRLRFDGGQFEQMLLDGQERTVGRLDTRYTGPTLDPLAKKAGYDPQEAAIGAAYVAAYNDYARGVLGFARDARFVPFAEFWKTWEWKHKAPGLDFPQMTPNVSIDLAAALKINPRLRVLVNSGMFDLATPFFAAEYELEHLGLPAELHKNIEIRTYPAGHMMYVQPESLRALHEAVARFITGAAPSK
jgi:carboxypeptidase C (cathepsin A)